MVDTPEFPNRRLVAVVNLFLLAGVFLLVASSHRGGSEEKPIKFFGITNAVGVRSAVFKFENTWPEGRLFDFESKSEVIDAITVLDGGISHATTLRLNSFGRPPRREFEFRVPLASTGNSLEIYYRRVINIRIRYGRGPRSFWELPTPFARTERFACKVNLKNESQIRGE